jgi:SAM-dependent methyltransferase
MARETALPGTFVVSTGRCGSTMLSNMLRLNPDILSLSEFLAMLLPDPLPPGDLDAAAYWRVLTQPRPFFTHAYRLGIRVPEFLYRPGAESRFTPADGIPPILITTLPHLSDDPEGLYDEVGAFVADLPSAAAAAQHRRLFEWLCARAGARAWVERSGSSLLYLSQLTSAFPDARFVHLYRDGRECAYSMSRNAGYRLGAIAMMLHARLGVSPYLNDDKPPEHVPPDLRPFMPGTFDHEAFERFEVPVAQLGQLWSDMVTPALDILDSLPPERVLQLSYEDLIAEPEQALRRLARFADLPHRDPGWPDRAASLVQSRPPRWPALPEDQKSDLTRVCEPAMRRLYGGVRCRGRLCGWRAALATVLSAVHGQVYVRRDAGAYYWNMPDYDLLAKFYDRLMSDSALRSEQVMRCIERYSPTAASLLELGCGTGAVLHGISAVGSLSGMDISPIMLDLARARLPGAEFIQGDISSFDLRRRFDVIVCTYDVLNHLPEFNRWISCFACASKHLTEGGLFIFDINTVGHLRKVASERPQVREFDGNTAIIAVSTEGRSVYTWDVRIFEHAVNNQYRLYHSQFRELAVEIRQILEAMPSGFELLDLADSAGGTPDDESERAFFVYRRRSS